MTEDDHATHRELAEQLHATLERLREDVASRSDPMLGEVVRAVELLLDIATHAHDHALDNRERIAALEQRSPAARQRDWPDAPPGG